MLTVKAISARSYPTRGEDYESDANWLFLNRGNLEPYFRTIGKVDGKPKTPEYGFEGRDGHVWSHRNKRPSLDMGGCLEVVVEYRYHSGKKEKGYIEVPISVAEAMGDVTEIHSLVGTDFTDFDRDPTRIVLPVRDPVFKNPLTIHRCLKGYALFEHPEKPVYHVEIHIPGAFTPTYEQELKQGAESIMSGVRRGGLGFDRVVGANVGGFGIDVCVLKRTVIGQRGFGAAILDAGRFFDNFMDWYTDDSNPSGNSATRWLDENEKARDFSYSETGGENPRAAIESAIKASRFSFSGHRLAPWVILKGGFISESRMGRKGMPTYLIYNGMYMSEKDRLKALSNFDEASNDIHEIEEEVRGKR